MKAGLNDETAAMLLETLSPPKIPSNTERQPSEY